MWNYQKRASEDVRRWQEQGWIGGDGAAAILQDLASRRSGLGTASALAILGAVLIGFAAMSFVAANWQEMSRLARLALLFAGMAGSYGAAGALAVRNMPHFANAATLIGVGVFGASIMLIAQMFHIEGNPPDAVLLWAAGTLLAGAALSSTTALGLSMPLIMLWGAWEQSELPGVFWWFLAGWAAVSLVYYYHRWRPGLHLSGLALTGFVISLGSTLWSGRAYEVVVLCGFAAMLAAYGLQRFLDEDFKLPAHVVFGYGLVTAFAGLFALQFFEKPTLGALVALAALTLVLLLATIAWSLKSDQRAMAWLGYGGFSIEVLALYFKTFETLLGSSLFFLIAGLIVIALSGVAYKLHGRAVQMEGPDHV